VPPVVPPLPPVPPPVLLVVPPAAPVAPPVAAVPPEPIEPPMAFPPTPVAPPVPVAPPLPVLPPLVTAPPLAELPAVAPPKEELPPVACSPPVPEAPEPPPPDPPLPCFAVPLSEQAPARAAPRIAIPSRTLLFLMVQPFVESQCARSAGLLSSKEVFVKLQVAPLSARAMDRCPRVSGSGSVSDQRLPRTAHEHAHALAYAIRGPTCAGPPFPEQS
jgi:hypothetical protein